MKKLLIPFLFFGLFSCIESNIEQIDSGESGESDQSEESGGSGQQDIVTDVYGTQYPGLDPSVIYCGPGWGEKMCHFLHKYNETIWTDRENYFSDFSDVKFSNFQYNQSFISFFKIDSIASYCEGWGLGERINNGIKWNIIIKKDQEDVLWFDYEYYGSSSQIEYTINYKYEVINGNLNFSSSDGQTFIFNPSEKNYSKDSVDTGEIIELDGCMFY